MPDGRKFHRLGDLGCITKIMETKTPLASHYDFHFVNFTYVYDKAMLSSLIVYMRFYE